MKQVALVSVSIKLLLLCAALEPTTSQTTSSTAASSMAVTTTADISTAISSTSSGTTIPALSNPTVSIVIPMPSSIEFEETAIPPHTDLALCTCDLTVNFCDINCCCDDDCSNIDRTVFSACDDALLSGSTDSDMCSYEVKVFKDNSVTTETVNNPAVFCIWREQNSERNYYTPVNLVKSDEQFVDYADQYRSFTYEYQYSLPQTITTSENYKSGQILVTLQTSITDPHPSILLMPTQLGSTTSCIDINPAKFLSDVSNSCMRNLDAPLSTTCETNTKLNVGDLIRRLNKTVIKVRPDTAIDIASGISIKVSGETAQPIYNTTRDLCFNVITQVDYTISHKAGVIRSAEAVISLSVISGSLTAVEQKYTLKFVEADDTAIGFRRSGNPGYLVGEPVIAGRIMGDYVELNGDRNRYLTMIASTASGDCFADILSRKPILFGEDFRSGCLLKLKASEIDVKCTYIRTHIIEALLGPTRSIDDIEDTIYIASFGNSNPLKIGDWVKVIISNDVLDNSCVGVALHLEILYANVGALYNPQSMIIGAKLYLEPITITFQSQNSDETRNFEVMSSVAFVDVSLSPQPVIAEKPVAEAKLGPRFFHPYYISGAISRTLIDHLVLTVCSVLVVLLCV